jgi:hypothetical protein
MPCIEFHPNWLTYFWHRWSSFMSPYTTNWDRLCGLVVRVSGYRSRGPGFDSRRFQIFWEAVGLERGPLSLVRTTEELLGRNSSGSGQENRDQRPGGIRCADHARPSIRKSWHYFANKRRSLGRHSSLGDQSHWVFFYTAKYAVDRRGQDCSTRLANLSNAEFKDDAVQRMFPFLYCL